LAETNRQRLLDRRIGAAWRQAAALPLWSDPVEPSDLRGGLSNVNFVVEDAGRKFVIRIGGDNDVHGVVRKNELAASRAAYAAGVAPRVAYAEPGVLVLDFIDGRTYTPEDVRNPKNLPRIIELIQRTHREIPKNLRGPGVARRSSSAPSVRSTLSSATTTCLPPTSWTTASGSGWSTGNMQASTRRSSTSAALLRTASLRRLSASSCSNIISTGR
jgi:hypothetical protein